MNALLRLATSDLRLLTCDLRLGTCDLELPASKPALAERPLRRRRLAHHDLDVRILAKRHARRLRCTAAILEHEGHLIARLVPLQRGGDVAVARHSPPVDLQDLIVEIDARAVD